MSGLLRRIRRPGAAEETRTEPTALPDPAHGSAPADPATGEDGQRLPAGVAPEDVERREVTGRRGKLRRRARFLHKRPRARRCATSAGSSTRRAAASRTRASSPQEKVRQADRARRGAERDRGRAGRRPRGETVVREPGVGGTCARCGELHASDATFCARCGANLAEAAREAAAAEAERRAAAEKAARGQGGGREGRSRKAATRRTRRAEKPTEAQRTASRRRAADGGARAGRGGQARRRAADRGGRRAREARRRQRPHRLRGADRGRRARDEPGPVGVTERRDSSARRRDAGLPAVRRRARRPIRSGA